MFVLFQDFLLALCKKPKSVEGEVGSVICCVMGTYQRYINGSSLLQGIATWYLSEIH